MQILSLSTFSFSVYRVDTVTEAVPPSASLSSSSSFSFVVIVVVVVSARRDSHLPATPVRSISRVSLRRRTACMRRFVVLRSFWISTTRDSVF